MRMETYVRKSLRMKTHWVTEVVEAEEEWVAWVDHFGNRRLRCGHRRGRNEGNPGQTSGETADGLSKPSFTSKVYHFLYKIIKSEKNA